MIQSVYQSSSSGADDVGVVLAVSNIDQVENVAGVTFAHVVAGLVVAGLLIPLLAVYSSIHDTQNL